MPVKKYVFIDLILGVQTRNLQLAIQMIDIEKDFNFGNGEGKKDPNLVHLQRFHLIGPFGPDVTGYLIKGANQLKNLALTIGKVQFQVKCC